MLCDFMRQMRRLINKFYSLIKTSVTWSLQNFPLYNGTIMLMIKKENFKLVRQSLPFCDECTIYKLNNINFKKEQRF